MGKRLSKKYKERTFWTLLHIKHPLKMQAGVIKFSIAVKMSLSKTLKDYKMPISEAALNFKAAF